MNFLDMCRRVRRDCGISGTDTSPASVLNQTGKMLLIVEWTGDAWRELQGRCEFWNWMRVPFTVNTVVGDDSYAYGDCTDTLAGGVISRFRRWLAHDNDDRYTIYLQSGGVAGQRELFYMPWADFRRLYRFGVQQTQNGPPIHVSVDPQRNLVLGPKPDAVYVVGGDFMRGAQELTADGSTPDMPIDYHMLVPYNAMLKYAGYAAAGEVYQTNERERYRLLRQLEANQMAQMRFAGPLA